MKAIVILGNIKNVPHDVGTINTDKITVLEPAVAVYFIIETTNNDEVDSIIVFGNDISSTPIYLNITDDATGQTNLPINFNNFNFESELVPDTDDINKSIIENNVDSIKNETDDHRKAANFEYELGSSDGDLYNNDGVTNAITSQKTRGNIDMANIGPNNNEHCNVDKIETIIKKFHHQILFCQSVNDDNNVNNQQTSHDQANDDDESWLRRAVEIEVRAGCNLDKTG
nr:9329_t:CDS:2 [Entrophospora candida]